VHGALAETFDLVDYLIWAVFTVDYGVRLYLVPRRWAFVRSHSVDLAVVALPFLRLLRAMRLLAATRLAALLWTGLSPAPPGGTGPAVATGPAVTAGTPR
jgi:hypothetical protein